MSSFATIHTRSDGDSSKLCERSSILDVVEVEEQVNFITTIRPGSPKPEVYLMMGVIWHGRSVM